MGVNMNGEVTNSGSHPEDILPAWPPKILRARENAQQARSPESPPTATGRAQAEGVRAEAEHARRRGQSQTTADKHVALPRKAPDRLSALGIYPEGLAGRLRLVLTIGCYRDFRF